MDYQDFTAKTVDEAIIQACIALGITSDRLEYEVKQEPTNGFLGIGARPAVIRARRGSEEEKNIEKAADEETASVVSKVFAGEKHAGKKASSGKKSASAKAKPDAKKEKKAEEVKTAEAMPHGKAAAEKEELSFKEEFSADILPGNETGADDSRIITSDEIEKRAAAAAAKARSEGREDKPLRDGRRESRKDGRSGDRGRRNARGKERGRSFEREREIPDTAARPEPSKPKPDRVVKERTEEEAAAIQKTALDFLQSVFSAMEIEAQIQTEYIAREGCVCCTFDGDDMGILIGKRGQTLDSLQYLTSLVVNKTTDEYVRVKLDTEDYRARRADTLNNLARNIAYKVKKTRRPVALEPMNPYERRIIHSALQENKFVETYSEGDEPYRHVVVAPKR